MTLAEEPDVEAGDSWTMSVYALQAGDGTSSADSVSADSISATSLAAALTSASSAGSVQANGASSTVTIGDIPATASGDRSFTVVNACAQTIRIGSTGGR